MITEAATIAKLKQNIFDAELKLSKANLTYRIAAEEFEKSESASTFNAMDDARLEALEPQIELEGAIALLQEHFQEKQFGETFTLGDAELEFFNATEAWLDANKKFDDTELKLPTDFEKGDMDTPEVEAWVEAMRVANVASKAVDAAQAKVDFFDQEFA